MANDQEGMDCGALHLKPFVIIDSSHVQEDRAVGPDSTVSNGPADDGSFSEEREEICINNGRPILVEKSTEHDEKSENPLYTMVSLRKRTMPYHIIVYDSSVFYEKAVYDEEVVEGRPCEAEVEQSHDEDVHYVTDSLFQNLHWFTEDSPVEKLSLEGGFSLHVPYPQGSHKHHYFHHLCLAVNMEAGLQKLSTCFPKVSGKRQRRKKLMDLFGAFDTFHFLNPAPVQVVVFPVQRQKKGEDQKPDDQAAGESSGSGHEAWPPDRMNGRPWADFRQELYRLGTFVNIPASFPVSVLGLARAGFLCRPDGVILCYFCGMQHDQWRVGESPVEVHRQMNPNCSVLTGVNCNNIPVTVLTGDQVQPLMQIWSLSGPSSLSDSGRDPGRQVPAANQGEVLSHMALMSMIYQAQSAPNPYTGNQQSVAVGGLGPGQASATAPTSGQSASANSHQNVAVSHRPARANADREQANEAAGAGSISQDNDQQQQKIVDGAAQPGDQNGASGSSAAGEERTRQVVTYAQLGIIREAPKRPEMATVWARVVSFRNWPFTDTLTPLALAQAGFYYAGFGDYGCCFHCGGGLRNWNPTDNPWVEHARRFNNCAYVRLCQGQDFLDVVSELSRQGGGSSGDPVQISMAQVQEDLNARRLVGDYIPERTLDPAICAAQPLGCSQDAIDDAAQRLQADGHQLTADRLVDYLEEDGVFAGADAQGLTEEGDESDVEQLARQNLDVRQQHLCKICMDQEANIIFLSCGHMVCCTECSPPVLDCPVCRQTIKGKLRAFPC